MTFDRDKVTDDAAVGAGAFSEVTAAALPVIVEAVLAEIEQLHQPMPGSVSALHPIPLCTCLISESPCPTARACAALGPPPKLIESPPCSTDGTPPSSRDLLAVIAESLEAA